MRFVYEICKLQREWKREWNRLTELLLALNWSSLPQWYVLFDSLLVFWLVGTWHARHLIWHTLFTSRVYSCVVLSLSGLSTDTRVWWLGILICWLRVKSLSEVQSDRASFASFLMVAGCYISFGVTCFAMPSRRNYPTRLETRTEEFNWIASRRV